MTREGFKAVLHGYAGMRVAGEATSIQQALRNPSLKAAEIILVETRSNRNGFPDAFRHLVRVVPEAKIVGHSSELLNPKWVNELFSEGMKGYLTKNVANEELYYAVAQVAAGGMYFTPGFTMALLKFEKLLTVASEYVSDLTLTEHELETLKLVAEGHTNRDIAIKLSLNARTVEARRKRLLKKTSSKNTAALIRYAVQYGLL